MQPIGGTELQYKQLFKYVDDKLALKKIKAEWGGVYLYEMNEVVLIVLYYKVYIYLIHHLFFFLIISYGALSTNRSFHSRRIHHGPK